MFILFFIFDKKVSKEDLVEIKHKITSLEKKYSSDEKRKINLDPGLIDSKKLILASFKKGTDYKEELKGVYLHTVLEFNPLKEFWHTFPDYKKFKEKFSDLTKKLFS